MKEQSRLVASRALLVVLHSIHTDLAHIVDTAIVINEMQLATPTQVLSAVGLIELDLQWKC